MVSGYIAITKYYHVNAGQRERKIYIWLFMNKVLYVAPSNRRALHSKTTAKGTSTSKWKLPQAGKHDKGSCSKKIRASSYVVHNKDWDGITSVEVPLVLQTEWTDYRYFPIDEESL